MRPVSKAHAEPQILQATCGVGGSVRPLAALHWERVQEVEIVKSEIWIRVCDLL